MIVSKLALKNDPGLTGRFFNTEIFFTKSHEWEKTLNFFCKVIFPDYIDAMLNIEDDRELFIKIERVFNIFTIPELNFVTKIKAFGIFLENSRSKRFFWTQSYDSLISLGNIVIKISKSPFNLWNWPLIQIFIECIKTLYQVSAKFDYTSRKKCNMHKENEVRGKLREAADSIQVRIFFILFALKNRYEII